MIFQSFSSFVNNHIQPLSFIHSTISHLTLPPFVYSLEIRFEPARLWQLGHVGSTRGANSGLGVRLGL